MSQPATDPPTLPPPHMLTSTLPMETILLVSNTLFESSRAIQGIAGDILLNNSPFSSYDDFIAAIETQLLCLFVSGSGLPPIDETGRANIEESFTDIMAAHPRVGGEKGGQCPEQSGTGAAPESRSGMMVVRRRNRHVS